MRPRCEHYALSADARARRCRRRATLRLRVGGRARVWLTCVPCAEAIRRLWAVTSTEAIDANGCDAKPLAR